jgi:hypothetical protein
MAVKQRKQLTEEERAARRERDRDYARQAVERLRSSEGWKAWLTTRATFHGYSLGNQLLIAMQRPTATKVAGFRAWLKLGYCVSCGETAIRIWAPCPPSRKQLEQWKRNGADPDQRPRTFFKLAAVFDRLSRVRSGGCRRRPSRGYAACRSPACVARPRQRHGEGDGCGLRGRRGAGARGRRRSGDRARASPVPPGTEAR